MTKDKKYLVPLSEIEMQFLSNACAAFYRVCNNEHVNVDLTQTMALLKVMERFKMIVDGNDKVDVTQMANETIQNLGLPKSGALDSGTPAEEGDHSLKN